MSWDVHVKHGLQVMTTAWQAKFIS